MEGTTLETEAPERAEDAREPHERTVWKWALPDRGLATLVLPVGASVLTAQVQGETLTLWALADPSAEVEERRFLVVGSGSRVPRGFGHGEPRWVATAQPSPGVVSHVFEV